MLCGTSATFCTPRTALAIAASGMIVPMSLPRICFNRPTPASSSARPGRTSPLRIELKRSWNALAAWPIACPSWSRIPTRVSITPSAFAPCCWGRNGSWPLSALRTCATRSAGFGSLGRLAPPLAWESCDSDRSLFTTPDTELRAMSPMNPAETRGKVTDVSSS